jgi:hypothetical protein
MKVRVIKDGVLYYPQWQNELGNWEFFINAKYAPDVHITYNQNFDNYNEAVYYAMGKAGIEEPEYKVVWRN